MEAYFFFSSRRRHTSFDCDWSSDVCSADLEGGVGAAAAALLDHDRRPVGVLGGQAGQDVGERPGLPAGGLALGVALRSEERRVGEACRLARGGWESTSTRAEIGGPA